VAAAAGLVVLTLSGRYGYHRDEFYFLACGRHLAWGYPDQPPLVPLLARLMSSINGTSLVVLRLPSDLAVVGTVYLTGRIARELAAGPAAQTLAAAAMAVSNITLGSGHLLSTTTLDLAVWAGLLWLILVILRTGRNRLWLVAGGVAGIGLLDSDLVVFLAVAVAVGLMVAGPRAELRNPWLWGGIAIAVALWSPYLVWQAQHGWPQLAVARSIASGGSGTSAPRWQIPVQQLILASPPLAPIWIAGLVRLLRNPAARWARALGHTWWVLLILFVVSGGKPYYLAGTFPLLFAAGAQPALDWGRRHGWSGRGWVTLLTLTAVVDGLVTLPLLPVGVVHDTPVVALNYDAGETVGWPTFVAQVDQVYAREDPGGVVLASNYGEAGALQRYGTMPDDHVFAVHNAYWLWGPPPASATRTIAVGFGRAQLTPYFTSVRLQTRVDNHEQISNDEQGAPVWLCAGLTRPWSAIWPASRLRLTRAGVAPKHGVARLPRRESAPSVHRPGCPAATIGSAGRAGAQPALVVASRDVGRLRGGRPGHLGGHRARSGEAAR
jgi:hypothetical protein